MGFLPFERFVTISWSWALELSVYTSISLGDVLPLCSNVIKININIFDCNFSYYNINITIKIGTSQVCRCSLPAHRYLPLLAT